MVLVGAEIATGTFDTNVSEFKNDKFKNTFAKQSLDDIAYFNIHEYIHTQQKPNSSTQLLNQVIKEGSCDFDAELVLNHPIQRPYLSYGNLHFYKLKEQFKKEMFLKPLYHTGFFICRTFEPWKISDRRSDPKKAVW